MIRWAFANDMLIATAVAALLGSCNAIPAADSGAASRTASTPTVAQAPVAAPAPAPTLTPTPAPPPGPSTFLVSGQETQGGWIRGQAPAGTRSATLGGQALTLDPQGRFFAAFDRDAGPSTSLRAVLADGQVVQTAITVSPRDWKIEHVNVARRAGGASETFMARRRPELAKINAARSVDHDTDGWSQNFIWPVKGRISGWFGSQRIYRGEPGSYHGGIDIATGESGTPFVAPADGVVTLAAQTPFSLEGHLLIIDHGQGLNSAFLHCSSLAVREGDVVRQGQYIGNIGASGRATGPHLHWALKWRKARLDPLLFVGPMN